MNDDPISAAKDLFSEAAQAQLRLDVDRLMRGGNIKVTSAPGYGGVEPVKPAEYGPRKREFEPTTEIIPRLMDAVPELHCTLYRKTGGTRTVVVTEGYVTEFIPKNTTDGDPPETVDGVKEWKIDGIWDTGTPNLLQEHAIETGWSIGVAFPVDERGYITGDPDTACYITTRDPDAEGGEISTHYIPPVGEDGSGASGTVYIILARLVGTGDGERLHVYHDGNVHHYHELSPFRKHEDAEGVDIFHDYDPVAGEYRYHGIRGETIEEDPDPKMAVSIVGQDVVINWTDGPNLNLVVRSYTLTQGPTQDTQVYITLAERVITTDAGGTHVHKHTDYLSEGSQVSISQTGDWELTVEGYPTRNGDDGAHSHTFTVPAETVSATISLPGTVGMVVDSAYYTICWRDRLFHSVVAGGDSLPAAVGDVQTKTIYTPNMAYQFDLSDPDNIENSYLIPLL